LVVAARTDELLTAGLVVVVEDAEAEAEEEKEEDVVVGVERDFAFADADAEAIVEAVAVAFLTFGMAPPRNGRVLAMELLEGYNTVKGLATTQNSRINSFTCDLSNLRMRLPSENMSLNKASGRASNSRTTRMLI
jgi:hypothetical protein